MRKFRFMTVVITMLTALMCLFSQETTAQNTNKIKVSGVVMDSSGEPLPGVGVLIKGTKTGSFTDVDGKFTISVSPDAVLEVSSMGYVSETVKVNGKTKLSIWLNSDSTVLDDVVVIGYGSVKKQDLTGSVTNVQMNDLKAAPAVSGQRASGKNRRCRHHVHLRRTWCHDHNPNQRFPFHYSIQRAAYRS